LDVVAPGVRDGSKVVDSRDVKVLSGEYDITEEDVLIGLCESNGRGITEEEAVGVVVVVAHGDGEVLKDHENPAVPKEVP
jgi:hypothetical protein